MASSVFYKFNSRKDESRVSFDGTGISVFDLKREIILANNMGKANDFDLYIYDATSKQEFKDDSTIIPRSSSVIVKRLPAARPGKGKASLYVNGTSTSMPTSEPVSRGSSVAGGWHKGAMSKRFDGKEDTTTVSPKKSSTPVPIGSSITKDDEAAAMAAMFQAQTQNWEETQEKMSHSQRIYSNSRGTGFNRGGKPFQSHMAHHDKPLPPSYVCYRCGQKGHWIQDCPTNSDRDFDNRPRIKRTTGIPRSMLKAVDNPNSSELTQGVMVTPDGGYVVAQPDLASWQKQVSRSKGLTAAEVREKAPSDPTLACPIDNKLFRDAVKTPCCSKVYCEECIQTHLLEKDFICPNCGKKIQSLDKLIMDKPSRTKVSDYIEKAIEESRKESGEEGSNGKDESNSRQQSTAPDDGSALEQDIYSDQQPDMNLDMSQMVVDQIPQLQAQLNQISQALQNPNLPNHVRQQTEMQCQQLQIQLQQAQAVASALALATYQQQAVAAQSAANANLYGLNSYQQQMGGWNQFGGQQPPGQDSAYQRLPVNNRRRNLKRERPSDFVETTNPDGTKVPRYWE